MGDTRSWTIVVFSTWRPVRPSRLPPIWIFANKRIILTISILGTNWSHVKPVSRGPSPTVLNTRSQSTKLPTKLSTKRVNLKRNVETPVRGLESPRSFPGTGHGSARSWTACDVITALDLFWAPGQIQSAAVKAPIGIGALQVLAHFATGVTSEETQTIPAWTRSGCPVFGLD